LADDERLRPRIPASSYWSWRAYILARSGKKVEARHALEELLRLNVSHPVDPMTISQAYAGLGDRDQAIVWLEKAYTQHSSELIAMKVNPYTDLSQEVFGFGEL